MTSLENDILKYWVRLQFLAINNEARYEAVLASLRVARALGVKNVRLRSDSKLIVGQITNKYEEKEERMKKYLQLMSQLIDEFDNVKLELISREENSTADEIARLALTEDASAMEGLLMEVQTTLVLTDCKPFRSNNKVTRWNNSYPTSKTTNSHQTHQKQRRSESKQQGSLF